MKLLAVDSSAVCASVAVTDGTKLVSECYVNASLTHSSTLIPMVNNALSQANLKIEDIEAVCVNTGPGSFTGIRIGVAAVKGLAFPHGLPCASVSTLESMAYNFTDEDCVICGTMDARCNQVYMALFRSCGGIITRLCEDKAISIDALEGELSQINEKIYLAGDGAVICYEKFGSKYGNIVLAGEARRYQRAYAVALAALNNNKFIPSAEIVPVYLRPSQAERELKAKKQEDVK